MCSNSTNQIFIWLYSKYGGFANCTASIFAIKDGPIVNARNSLVATLNYLLTGNKPQNDTQELIQRACKLLVSFISDLATNNSQQATEKESITLDVSLNYCIFIISQQHNHIEINVKDKLQEYVHIEKLCILQLRV